MSLDGSKTHWKREAERLEKALVEANNLLQNEREKARLLEEECAQLQEERESALAERNLAVPELERLRLVFSTLQTKWWWKHLAQPVVEKTLRTLKRELRNRGNA